MKTRLETPNKYVHVSESFGLHAYARLIDIFCRWRERQRQRETWDVLKNVAPVKMNMGAKRMNVSSLFYAK